MNLTRLRLVLAPAVLAAATFILGFGVMLTLWLSSHSHATPGWPHYRAATFGDGVLVPVLASSLFASARWLRAKTDARTPVWILGLTALIAAAAGALLQLSWLADNHPQTNWSLPRPHHFAPSGWYHAVFLIAAATLISTLAADVLFQLRRAHRSRPRRLRTALARGEMVALALTAGWTFCLLVAFDGGQGSSATATIGSVLTLMVASLLALGWVVRSMLLAASSAILSAAVGSLGIAILCERWPYMAGTRLIQPAALIVALSLADGAKQAYRRWSIRIPKSVALAAAAGAACLVPMGHHVNLGVAILLSAAPLALSAAIETLGMSRPDRDPIFQRAAPWVLCLIIPITDYIYRGQKSTFLTAGLTFLVASIVVSRLTFPFLKKEWVEFNAVENLDRPDDDSTLPAIAKQVVYRMICLGAAILVAFTQIIFAVGPSLGFVQGTGRPSIRAALYITSAVIVVLAAISERAPSRPTTPEIVPVLLVVLAVTLSTLIVTVSLSGKPHSGVLLVTAVQVLLVFAWQVESVLGNAMMRGIGTRRALLCVGIAGASVIASLDFWAATAGQLTARGTPADGGWCLLEIAAVIAATVLWSYVCGKVLDPVKGKVVGLKKKQKANYRLASSQLQDAAIMGLLTAGLVWTVGLTFSHIPQHADERVSAILTLLIGTFLFFTAMFKWTLENNVKNADEFHKKAFPSRPPRREGRLLPVPARHLPMLYRAAWRTHRPGVTDDRRFSYVLDAHIAAQNLTATIMLVLTVAGAVGIANEIEAET